MNDTFAVRLVRAMNAKGFNISQLAKAAYLHKSSVHSYTMNIALPNTRVLLKLCKALDVDPNTLLGWNDEAR